MNAFLNIEICLKLRVDQFRNQGVDLELSAYPWSMSNLKLNVTRVEHSHDPQVKNLCKKERQIGKMKHFL